jgi:3-hydroxy-3-methylglutaryl CoA synthase
MTRGIHSLGSYLPRLRLARETIAAQTGWLEPAMAKRAGGHRTVANWDEDALTMATAAARRALPADASVDALTFASTTAPFLDRSNAGLMGDALGLPADVERNDASGSQRAATGALRRALDTAGGTELIAAGDRRVARVASEAELRFGDGAAAVLVGPGAGLAEYLGGASVHQDVVHQYRTAERDTDYVLEDRWVRDVAIADVVAPTMRKAAEACAVALSDIRHLILPIPLRHARQVCRELKLDPAVLVNDLAADIGETGVGHALLQLNFALATAQPGDVVALAGVGQGCDAIFLRVTDAIDSARPTPALGEQINSGVELDAYLKLPAFSDQLVLDRGLRAEADKRTALSVHARRRAEINSMMGSQCTRCETPHFPRALICVSCGSDQMRDYGFAQRRAHLKTFTEDWQAYTPAPPLCYGNVAFEGGGNAFLTITDVSPGQLKVGTELTMAFRLKDIDKRRGFRRYFFKGVPV